MSTTMAAAPYAQVKRPYRNASVWNLALIRIKPGMNTEVEIHIGQRQGVLAVPNAALRTPKDVASAASVLGLDTLGSGAFNADGSALTFNANCAVQSNSASSRHDAERKRVPDGQEIRRDWRRADQQLSTAAAGWLNCHSRPVCIAAISLLQQLP